MIRTYFGLCESAMIFYHKFLWVCKSNGSSSMSNATHVQEDEEKKTSSEDTDDRSVHYVWDAKDIIISGKDSIEKEAEVHGFYSTKSFPVTPKPDRHVEDRGLPLWHVSNNWADGPHIKTPEGWVPYDQFIHHDSYGDKWKEDEVSLRNMSVEVTKFRNEANELIQDVRLARSGAISRFYSFLDRLNKYFEDSDKLVNDYTLDYATKVKELALLPRPKTFSRIIGSDLMRVDNSLNALSAMLEKEVIPSSGKVGRLLKLSGDEAPYRFLVGYWSGLQYSRQKSKKQEKRLSPEEKEAVAEYGHGGKSSHNSLFGLGVAETINKYLREFGGDTGKFNNESKRLIENLDGAISKSEADENVIAFRGLDLRGVLENLGIESGHVKELEGRVIRDHGYVSTSISEEVAKGFCGGNTSAVLHIKIPKGSRVLFLDSMKDKYKGEAEALLPRGSSFRILKVDTSEGESGGNRARYKILMEYLG